MKNKFHGLQINKILLYRIIMSPCRVFNMPFSFEVLICPAFSQMYNSPRFAGFVKIFIQCQFFVVFEQPFTCAVQVNHSYSHKLLCRLLTI